MTPEALAAIHARAFTDQRPWTAAEFAALLASPQCLLLTDPMGFLLARILAGEAEILTLAVDPAGQRQGRAHGLMARFLAAAAGRADTAFLDVAADNTPALALYHGAGFAETGRRPAYFARPGRPAADAILMARALRKS